MNLFGVLLLDREPLSLTAVPGLVMAWLQDAGGFAALGLIIYLLAVMLAPKDQPASQKLRMPVTGFMVAMAVLSLLTYALMAAAWAMGKGATPADELLPPAQVGEAIKYVPPTVHWHLQPILLALGGLFAILGIAQPFVRDLFKLRFRRIMALGKICFKEAIRNRIFLAFLVFLVFFLFPVSWVGTVKPEDELRSPINILTTGKNIFLTIPFLILAAFAIPNDIKSNTLYTIVTKPVERFEIVLGRFLGYSALMTFVLLIMVSLSVIYVYTITLDPRAKEETFKSRVTARGKINFMASRGFTEGTNVGREFEYRKYIGGSPDTRERAVWSYDSIPGNLTRSDRDSVPLEYTFDIFRLTKGDENRGVDVNIRVCAWQTGQYPSPTKGDGIWRWTDPAKQKQYEDERAQINDNLKANKYGPGYDSTLNYARPGTPTWKLVSDLAKKYGFYEVPSVEVYDFRTGSVPIPVGVFQAAAEGDPKNSEGEVIPRLQVYIKCLSHGQMLGMAEADLYLVEGQRSFAENYYKASFGLWCRLVIVIGIAVTLSTYLAAMIALIGTLFLYLSAYFAEHIADIGAGTSIGGGPFESTLRMVRGESPTMPLDQNTGALGAITWGDAAYSWFFRRYANIIPDVDAFAWSDFLAEGYNVSWEYLVVNFLILVGYLLPWGVLAYYLMRNREVAA